MRLLLKQLKVPESVDGLAVVATIASYPDVPIPMRLQAAIILASYQRTRPARKISKPLAIPISKSVEEATAAIATLGSLAASGEIGLDEANDLIGFEKAFIEAKVGTDVEAQLGELREVVRRLEADGRAATVTVIGGLPRLPGTSVALPGDGDPEQPKGEP